jgi:hypothetical protein
VLEPSGIQLELNPTEKNSTATIVIRTFFMVYN